MGPVKKKNAGATANTTLAPVLITIRVRVRARSRDTVWYRDDNIFSAAGSLLAGLHGTGPV